MRAIARYFSMIFIVGMLLASTGCYLERDHDRQSRRDDRNFRRDRDDHREYNNRWKRDDPRNRDHRGDRDDRRDDRAVVSRVTGQRSKKT